MNETITVNFETITPIWTGDAWGENSEIKPSSIMGSLRFWFEVYCHFAGIEVKEKEELNYKKFIEKRKENPTKDEFEILQELGITLPSQIFGCTGWKSRIEIDGIGNIETFELNKNSIDYNFLFDKDNNTQWWTNKLLFDKKDEIKLFKRFDVSFNVKSDFALNEFKKFLKFYQDKPILMGGKKAFGLGFVRLRTDMDLNDIEIGNIKNKDYVGWSEIEIPTNNPKKILGFNIKYFLRQKEDRKFRVKNFGKMAKASDFYFSCVVNNGCHIISFNQDKKILNKYKKVLEKELSNNKKTKNNTKQTSLNIDDLSRYFKNR
jgi:CRISPR-associated protein Cmr1